MAIGDLVRTTFTQHRGAIVVIVITALVCGKCGADNDCIVYRGIGQTDNAVSLGADIAASAVDLEAVAVKVLAVQIQCRVRSGARADLHIAQQDDIGTPAQRRALNIVVARHDLQVQRVVIAAAFPDLHTDRTLTGELQRGLGPVGGVGRVGALGRTAGFDTAGRLGVDAGIGLHAVDLNLDVAGNRRAVAVDLEQSPKGNIVPVAHAVQIAVRMRQVVAVGEGIADSLLPLGVEGQRLGERDLSLVGISCPGAVRRSVPAGEAVALAGEHVRVGRHRSIGEGLQRRRRVVRHDLGHIRSRGIGPVIGLEGHDRVPGGGVFPVTGAALGNGHRLGRLVQAGHGPPGEGIAISRRIGQGDGFALHGVALRVRCGNGSARKIVRDRVGDGLALLGIVVGVVLKGHRSGVNRVAQIRARTGGRTDRASACGLPVGVAGVPGAGEGRRGGICAAPSPNRRAPGVAKGRNFRLRNQNRVAARAVLALRQAGLRAGGRDSCVVHFNMPKGVDRFRPGLTANGAGEGLHAFLGASGFGRYCALIPVVAKGVHIGVHVAVAAARAGVRRVALRRAGRSRHDGSIVVAKGRDRLRRAAQLSAAHRAIHDLVVSAGFRAGCFHAVLVHSVAGRVIGRRDRLGLLGRVGLAIEGHRGGVGLYSHGDAARGRGNSIRDRRFHRLHGPVAAGKGRRRRLGPVPLPARRAIGDGRDVEVSAGVEIGPVIVVSIRAEIDRYISSRALLHHIVSTLIVRIILRDVLSFGAHDLKILAYFERCRTPPLFLIAATSAFIFHSGPHYEDFCRRAPRWFH